MVPSEKIRLIVAGSGGMHYEKMNIGKELESVKRTENINRDDIVYTDTEKEYNKIISNIRSGNRTKDYTIDCCYMDSMKIINMIEKEFLENSRRERFVSVNDITNGRLVIDLSVGARMYEQVQAVKKSYLDAEKKCGVTDKMTDAQKVRQINRYICTNYTSVIGGYNMYDMMVNKRGSCVQHSMLFNHLCNRFGITVQNISLRGKDSGIGHMLNRVKIGNTWYYCDTMYNNGYGSGISVDETFLFIKDLKTNPRNGYGIYNLEKIIADNTKY